MYGIVCTTGSTAEIKGDSGIHTDEASAISTNNTTGVGNFSVSGNAQLIADGCAAIYQASMDYIDIFGNAKVIGGIVARMGRITVRENARVINNGFKVPYDDFGTYLPTSNGPAALPYGVFHAAGTYKGNGEDGSNDFVLIVKDNGSIKSKDGVDVMVADLGTGYDQSSTVDLKDNKTTWQVLSYDEAKEIVEASGATLKPKIAATVITVAVGDDIVYPYLPSQDEEVPADGE
jgi:hypothetical protein